MNTDFLPESMMVSYGYHPADNQGSVKCPLYQTSTFAFKTAEAGKAFFELAYGLRDKKAGEEQGMIYSRVNNPNLDLIEKRLALWDGGEAAAFFSSGMAAISTLVFTFLKPGDILLYGSPVYGGTDHFFNHVLPSFNINVVKFTARESSDDIIERIETMFPGKMPGLIYTEIPGNPTISLIDIEMCCNLAMAYEKRGKRPVLSVDNTFLGPVFQHPLMHGADISLYSATKFIGGHSDVIAGACVGNTVFIDQLKSMRTFLGCMLDPHSSWLVARSLETLKIRMEHQAITALKVAEYLKQHPLVEKIHYLGFLNDNDPQKAIFKKQCLSAGSMISFEIKGGEKEAFLFLNNLKLFKLAVSLGSTESLAEHPATMTHVDVSSEDRRLLGINENLVRLSIGLEDSDDLISAIKEAFSVISQVNKSLI